MSRAATRASRKQHQLASAMREVHKNTPRTVKATGKTGAAKEKMLRAIAFSKAGQSRKKRG